MKVLVFAESREGKLKGSSAEAVSAAKKLGGEVHAVVLEGKAADIAPELAQYGATKVFTVNNELTNTYQNEAFTQTLNELIQQGGYNTVVGVATPMGRDFFPRLAARNKAALLTDVIELTAEGEKVKARRPIYAGKCIVDVEPQTALPTLAKGLESLEIPSSRKWNCMTISLGARTTIHSQRRSSKTRA